MPVPPLFSPRRRSILCVASIIVALAGCSDAADVPHGNSRDTDPTETPRPSSPSVADSGALDRDAGASAAPLADAARPAVGVVDASAAQREDSGASTGADAGAQRDSVSDAGSSDARSTMTIALSSSVADEGMSLPKKHRCARSGGENVSPPLDWSAGPEATASYALVMRDVTNATVVFHWFIYDLPASMTALLEGVATGFQPPQPAGAKQGPSYSRSLGYQGPCGGDNKYEFTIYALDVAQLPSLSQSSTGAQIVSQIEQHQIASAKLTLTSSPSD